ncbi:MAG: hypothetical protein WDW36_008151 [Sanguina aurantia]
MDLGASSSSSCAPMLKALAARKKRPPAAANGSNNAKRRVKEAGPANSQQHRHTILGDSSDLVRAVEHLTAVDARFAPIFEAAGPPSALLAKSGSCFDALVRSIVSQQISTQAAASILTRVRTACKVGPGQSLSPERVQAVALQELRDAGLSAAKASYVSGMAKHFQDGLLNESDIAGLDDDSLNEALQVMKGVGPWTVQMCSMFHLGRADVLPVGDLGVRKGMQKFLGLPQLPSAAEMECLTAAWRPFRSVGSWAMWRLIAPTPTTPAAPELPSPAS